MLSLLWDVRRDWAPCCLSDSYPLVLLGVSPASVGMLVVAGGDLVILSFLAHSLAGLLPSGICLYQSALMDVSSAPLSIILYWCDLFCPVGAPPDGSFVLWSHPIIL